MSGIESIEDHWKIKEHKLTKTFRIKLIFMMIFSNLIVYCLGLQSESQQPVVKNHWFPFQNLKNKKIILQTKIFLDTSNLSSPIPITVLNSKNKIVAKKAWLHSIFQRENSMGHSTISRVEISDNELSKLYRLNEQSFKIFPFIKNVNINKENERINYEFIF
jgi:hypothetical protein